MLIVVPLRPGVRRRGRVPGLASLLLLAVMLPGIAHAWAENIDSYQPHRLWPGYFASSVNLLNENSSFEVGDANTAALDGCQYFQRTFKESVISPDANLPSAFQGFTFDTSVKQHGQRSLKISMDRPYYDPVKNESAFFALSWDYVVAPTDGPYDISFYARSAPVAPATQVRLRVSLHTLDDQGEWQAICVRYPGESCPEGEAHHRDVWVPTTWSRFTLRTTESLVAGQKYALLIECVQGSTPEATLPPGSIVWMDAVQFTTVGDGGTIRPFECHTSGEDIFLTIRRDGTTERTHTYLESEVEDLEFNVEIYQAIRRPPGGIYWSVYSLEGGTVPLASGDFPINFLGGSRKNYQIPFTTGEQTLGVFKLVVEYGNGIDYRVDREETSFAVIRDPVPLPAGARGNFGMHSSAGSGGGESWTSGHYPPATAGGMSLDEANDWLSRLGYHRQREFGNFNYGTVCFNPGCTGETATSGFVADEAWEHGIEISPVVNSVPDGFNLASVSDWDLYEDYLGWLNGLYGAGHTPRMQDWIFRNEMDAAYPYGQWDFLTEARYILHGAQVLGGDCVMTTLNWVIEPYLTGLFAQEVPEIPNQKVKDVLDGIGINTYLDYENGEFVDPELNIAGGGISKLISVHNAVEDAPPPVAVSRYALTETGYNPGSLQADRAVPLWDSSNFGFIDGTSGSLAHARDGAVKMIRHELMWLGSGASPVYMFDVVTQGYVPWNQSFGLMEIDGTPAGALAAQAQMNAELNAATLVQRIPPGDFRFYRTNQCVSSAGGSNEDHVYLYQDQADFVIVAWTSGTPKDLCVDVNPNQVPVTIRSFEGNYQPTGVYETFFTAYMSEAPCYIRITDPGLTPAEMVTRVDHRASAPPQWIEPFSWPEGDNLAVQVMPRNQGDVASVEFCYRQWTGGDWGPEQFALVPSSFNPSRGAVLRIPAEPLDRFLVKARNVEKTTGRFSEWGAARSVEYPDGKALESPAAPMPTDVLESIGPMPARGSAVLQGSVAAAGTVRLEVFDLAGRQVQSIEQRVSPGPFQIRWDGRAEGGRSAASGLYLVRLSRDGKEFAKKRLVFLN